MILLLKIFNVAENLVWYSVQDLKKLLKVIGR